MMYLRKSSVPAQRVRSSKVPELRSTARWHIFTKSNLRLLFPKPQNCMLMVRHRVGLLQQTLRQVLHTIWYLVRISNAPTSESTSINAVTSSGSSVQSRLVAEEDSVDSPFFLFLHRLSPIRFTGRD